MHASGLPSSIAAVALVLTAAGACSSSSASDELVAAFYPLEFVTARVAGRPVANLAPAGDEAHHLELSARDTASLHEAALVVYLSGFAPALDAAVADLAADSVLDVAQAARLDDHAEHAEQGHPDDEHADEHSDDEHSDGEHEHASGDPHFWLDPTRLADVGFAVAEQLASHDPESGDEYAARAAALADELAGLDAEFAAGLGECASPYLVTSHAAFGYLAERYGFTQVGIAGLSPEADPTPGRLAEVTDFVAEHGVTTIYYETLVDPAVAETIASETGAAVAVLDPLEGLRDESGSNDYFTVMRTNLATLRAGQGCR